MVEHLEKISCQGYKQQITSFHVKEVVVGSSPASVTKLG